MKLGMWVSPTARPSRVVRRSQHLGSQRAFFGPVARRAWPCALETSRPGLFSQLITIPLFREHKILSQVASHAGHTIKGNPHD
jgi:hypothetical protein